MKLVERRRYQTTIDMYLYRKFSFYGQFGPFSIAGCLVFGTFWQVKLNERFRQQFLLGQGKVKL
jgi:hypothetical protein